MDNSHSDVVHFFITEAKMDSTKFSKVSSDKLLRIVVNKYVLGGVACTNGRGKYSKEHFELMKH